LRQRHFRNNGKAAQTVFVTTFFLDFVPLFATDRLKVMMATSLMDDLRHYGSRLRAFALSTDSDAVLQCRWPLQKPLKPIPYEG
jgi:hypothetical protein